MEMQHVVGLCGHRWCGGHLRCAVVYVIFFHVLFSLSHVFQAPSPFITVCGVTDQPASIQRQSMRLKLRSIECFDAAQKHMETLSCPSISAQIQVFHVIYLSYV